MRAGTAYSAISLVAASTRVGIPMSSRARTRAGGSACEPAVLVRVAVAVLQRKLQVLGGAAELLLQQPDAAAHVPERNLRGGADTHTQV